MALSKVLMLLSLTHNHQPHTHTRLSLHIHTVANRESTQCVCVCVCNPVCLFACVHAHSQVKEVVRPPAGTKAVSVQL